MMAEAAIANDNGTAEYAGRDDKLDNPPTCSVAYQGEDAAGCEFESTLPPVATDPHDENYVKKLLSKLKSEEMFELRKLKHHQRPVSEFSSKQQLEQILVTKCKQASFGVELASDPPAQASSCSLTHSRVKEFDSRAQATQQVQSPEDLRPESIQLEIRGLFERKVVSGMLQSPIQAELERVVQDQHQQRRRPRRRRATGPPPSHRREAGAAGRVMAAVRHGARSRGTSFHRRGRNFQPPADGHYPVPRRDQSRILEHLRQSPALNSLDQEAREEIVSEVSSLVHQQLVSSALSGEFRGVLEFHIQERVDRVNQGATGENFLQSRRHGSRQSESPVDVDDRTEGTTSYNEVQREMREMKNQLAELKQMMRVSFDLQMDIQRSIRQEVSAALSMVLGSPSQTSTSLQSHAAAGVSIPNPCPIPTLRQSENASSTQADGAQAVEAGHCVICSDGIIDSVVYRCGHMCVCMACGLELKGQGLKCPICRAPITDIIRAYASML